MNPQLTLLKTEKEPLTFRRRPVPDELRRRAESVLEDFNRQTGARKQAYKGNGSPSDSLTRILGALVAWPEVTGAEWHEVIERALAEPWWSGRPSVGVVFGPKVVEQNLFPAAPIESAEARQKRERQERRTRRRAAMHRLKGIGHDAGSVGDGLPAS